MADTMKDVMRSCPYCSGTASMALYADAVLCDCGCVYRQGHATFGGRPLGPMTTAGDTERLLSYLLAAHYPSRARGRVLDVGTGFDDVTADGSFDSILCTTDSLHADINRCLDTIHAALGPDGLLVIQRNAFVEQRGYVGQSRPFSRLSDIFAPNRLVANWFMLAQYREFLGRRFTIEHAVTDSTGAGFINTYFCRRAERRDPAPLVMRDAALEYLTALGYQPLVAAA